MFLRDASRLYLWSIADSKIALVAIIVPLVGLRTARKSRYIHFVVFVGQWAKDIEEELTALLEKYFALPYFEFKYDEHWDLGHGWSGDL